MNKGEDLPEDRLFAARNIWLATVRPDGRPHLVPVWFVWVRERFYVCTAGQSVKAKNLIANPRASAALEDGDRPVIAEGRATILTQPYPDDVAAEFKRKSRLGHRDRRWLRRTDRDRAREVADEASLILLQPTSDVPLTPVTIIPIAVRTRAPLSPRMLAINDVRRVPAQRCVAFDCG